VVKVTEKETGRYTIAQAEYTISENGDENDNIKVHSVYVLIGAAASIVVFGLIRAERSINNKEKKRR
jgi:hypothetical protein